MKNIGGYQTGWGVGSLFESEGQKLYDLIRKWQPEVIVEIGRLEGCSTTWMATALKDNGKGKIYSIELYPREIAFPSELKPFIELINADALTYEFPEPIDMVFEDGEHTTGFTSAILKRYRAPMVVVHDFFHWDCGDTVHDEAIAVLGQPTETFIEPPSDCGLGIWIKA